MIKYEIVSSRHNSDYFAEEDSEGIFTVRGIMKVLWFEKVISFTTCVDENAALDWIKRQSKSRSKTKSVDITYKW